MAPKMIGISWVVLANACAAGVAMPIKTSAFFVLIVDS